jgi:two-component system, NarL family, nitrate/nitrite response regulator NarL
MGMTLAQDGEPVLPHIRVAIVADVRFYRDGIAQILGAHDDMTVVAAVPATQGAVRPVLELAPDVTLLDVRELDDPGALRALIEMLSTTRIVALGVAESESDLLDLVEVGVVGYVTSAGSLAELVAMVRCVARGESLASPRMVALLMRRLATLASGPQSSRPDARLALTSRERQVLALVDGGLSNKEIAHRLTIEVATVKNHVHNILEKLNVRRRSEAAALVRGDIGQISRE